MKIKISNCNNIDNGEISVLEGALNIKYAINGTGKSTIAKALKCKVSGDEAGLSSLLPFKYSGHAEGHEPNLEIDNPPQKVMIFDEEYLNAYTFQPDDLLKGSFEVLVRTPQYDNQMKKIETLTKDVAAVFRADSELVGLISDFEEFIKGFGTARSGYAENGAIAKGIGRGNKIDNMPEGLMMYKPYLQGDKCLGWLEWYFDGKEYLDMADTCPFCGGGLEGVRSRVEEMSGRFDMKEVKNFNKMAAVFRSLEKYFSAETREQVEGILRREEALTDREKKYLVEIKGQAADFLIQLKKLQTLSYLSFDDVRNVKSMLEEMVIKLELYPHLKSDVLGQKVEKLNGSLSSVLAVVRELQVAIGEQQTLIKRTVSRNQAKINVFLGQAGYPYAVKLDGKPDGSYKLMLRYVNPDGQEVNSARQRLSYGERNALSLVLFMFSALKEKADLIVLDDPISSFDGNKKFALMDLLFLQGSDECLKGKTVVMLTHDICPVIDAMKVPGIHRRFVPQPVASFVRNRGNRIDEIPITSSDIRNAISGAEEGIKRSASSLLKLVHLRHLVELLGNEGKPIYNLLSSLLHKRQEPTMGYGDDAEKMTEEDVASASREVAEKIGGFDYATEYAKTQDLAALKGLYDTAESGYEKMQIFRLIFDGADAGLTDVQRKFVNEAYHIEDEYLFQMDPCRYDTIPDFVIRQLDKAVENLVLH